MPVINVRLGHRGVWLEHPFRACNPGFGLREQSWRECCLSRDLRMNWRHPGKRRLMDGVEWGVAQGRARQAGEQNVQWL